MRPKRFPVLTRARIEEAARRLRRMDPALGAWIERIGPIRPRRQRCQFACLCRAIISQQLGAGAAKAIYRRFAALFRPARNPSPAALLRLRRDRLRRTGLSAPKIRYLQSLARAFLHGELSRVRLSSLPDEDVIERLTRLPGIGVWTAEMFLIFSLGRPDVFSAGDFALREGVRRVVGRDLSAAEIREISRRWAPYRTVASLYLWRIAHWDEEPRVTRRAREDGGPSRAAAAGTPASAPR